MKLLARVLTLVLVFQILAPTPSVLAAVTEVPLTVTVGAPRANPLTNTIDVPVTVKNDLGYAVPGPIAPTLPGEAPLGLGSSCSRSAGSSGPCQPIGPAPTCKAR